MAMESEDIKKWRTEVIIDDGTYNHWVIHGPPLADFQTHSTSRSPTTYVLHNEISEAQ